MQRRRRGQQNIQKPIQNYQGSFVYDNNVENNSPQDYPIEINPDDQEGTKVWKSDQVNNSQEYYPEYDNINDSIDYAQTNDAPLADYRQTDDEYSSYNDYYDDYDPEEDEEYQEELRRDRWKLVYFFINLCGAIFGLLLIFLLLSVVYNMVAWVFSDLLKIFGFLGMK